MNATATGRSSASGKANKPAANKSTKSKLSRGTAGAKKAAQARWQPRFESDEATRTFFLSCEEGEGLEALVQLRRQIDIACRAYEENVHGGSGQNCKTCDRAVGEPPAVRWWKRDTVTDPVTRLTHNEFYCSQPCWLAKTTQNGKASNRVVTGEALQPANR